MTLDHCTEGWLVADILKDSGYNIILGPILTDRSKIELKNQTMRFPGILSKAGIDVAHDRSSRTDTTSDVKRITCSPGRHGT